MKLNKYNLALLLLLFNVIIASGQSKQIWAEKDKSNIKYSMHHTLHDFSGVNNNVNCVIAYDPSTTTIQKVSVSANISDFNSGSSNRDSHVLEVTDAIKNPKVKFNSNKIEKNGNNLLITGSLTFHGVTKEIQIKATQNINGSIMEVKGNFNVSQEAYSVKRETFMMKPVDDIIEMEFLMTFKL